MRRAYAREIMATAGVSDPRVETAFAEVRREDFLGPGPWLVVGSLGDYIPTASADPAFLYLDRVVGIEATLVSSRLRPPRCWGSSTARPATSRRYSTRYWKRSTASC